MGRKVVLDVVKIDIWPLSKEKILRKVLRPDYDPMDYFAELAYVDVGLCDAQRQAVW